MCNTELLTRKFGEIRKYLDVVTPISICKEEDLTYENYINVTEIPETYNTFYVYGIGMIEEFFYNTLTAREGYQPCIEVIVSESPRKYTVK